MKLKAPFVDIAHQTSVTIVIQIHLHQSSRVAGYWPEQRVDHASFPVYGRNLHFQDWKIYLPKENFDLGFEWTSHMVDHESKYFAANIEYLRDWLWRVHGEGETDRIFRGLHEVDSFA